MLGFPRIACLLVRDHHIGLVVDVQIGVESPPAEPGQLHTGYEMVGGLCAIQGYRRESHLSPPIKLSDSAARYNERRERMPSARGHAERCAKTVLDHEGYTGIDVLQSIRLNAAKRIGTDDERRQRPA
jgi:hypothetical protein